MQLSRFGLVTLQLWMRTRRPRPFPEVIPIPRGRSCFVSISSSVGKRSSFCNQSSVNAHIDHICRKDRQWRYVKTAKVRTEETKFRKYSIVVRRIISSKGLVAEERVDIKSPKLADLLRELLKGLGELELSKSPPEASYYLVTLTTPIPNFHSFPLNSSITLGQDCNSVYPKK